MVERSPVLIPEGSQPLAGNGTSVGSILIFRVQVLEFGPGIVGGELPIDLGLLAIAFVLPGGCFFDQRFLVGNPASQALTSEDVQFDFRQVEPAAMLRCVNPLDPRDDPRASCGENASSSEPRLCVLRLSITSVIRSALGR